MSGYTPRVGDYVRKTVVTEGRFIGNGFVRGEPVLDDQCEHRTVTVEKIDPPLPPLPDHGVIRVWWKPGSDFHLGRSSTFVREPGAENWSRAGAGAWSQESLVRRLAADASHWVELVERGSES